MCSDISDRMQPGPMVPARRLVLELVFPRPPDDLAPVTVHVVIEDIAEADAHAPSMFKADFPDLKTRPRETTATLAIDLPQMRGEDPAIRVHVDRGATDAITTGDFINSGVIRLPAEDQARCEITLIEVT